MNDFYIDNIGRRYYLGQQFTYHGRVYQGTVQTFSELGFTEVLVQPMPNPIYYNVGNVNNDGTWTATAKPVPVVQESLSQEARSLTYGILRPSDWYVVRQEENGVPVPSDVGTYREACRVACESYIAALNLASSTEELEAVGAIPFFPAPLNSNGELSVSCVQGEQTLQILGNPLQATMAVADMFALCEGYLPEDTRVVSSDAVTGVVTLDTTILETSPEESNIIVKLFWVAP